MGHGCAILVHLGGTKAVSTRQRFKTHERGGEPYQDTVWSNSYSVRASGRHGWPLSHILCFAAPAHPCAMAGMQGIVGNYPCLLRPTSSIPGLAGHRLGVGRVEDESLIDAVVSAIRRALHDGHTPLPLHENAVRKLRPQPPQWARANPLARMPHARYRRNSSSTRTGIGSSSGRASRDRASHVSRS